MTQNGRGDDAIASYIVRIYRRGEIVGIVETPENGERSVFHSFEELQSLLNRERRTRHPPRRAKGRERKP